MMKAHTTPTSITSIHSGKAIKIEIIFHHPKPLVPGDEISIWHLRYDLCPRVPPPLEFGVATVSSRHSASADSVVIAIAIVVAIGDEGVGGVVQLVSLLKRLTLNVFVATFAPTVEEFMVVSRTVLVDAAVTALKMIKAR